MLRNLNRRNSSGAVILGTYWAGWLAADLPTGFALAGLLANDVAAGDAAGTRYRVERRGPLVNSSGQDFTSNLRIDENGALAFTGAPDGTYTAPERVYKYSPAAGLASAEDTTLTLTIGQAAVQPADTTNPTLPGAINLTAITTTGAHAAWAAGSDNVGVAGYEISVDTGTPSWLDLGNVLAYDISGKTAGASYTVRLRDYDAAGNRSAPITAALTMAPAQPNQSGGTGTITVPASRTAVFASRQRVAVFSTPSPVTLAKGAQDELFIVGDFTKDLTDAATTAISVAPVSDGVAVLVAPQLQGMLGVVKLGAFDPNVVAPSFTFRLTLENGEQIDRTIKFTVLDDRTHVFGKDPDDKRYWAFNLAADAARGTTSLASVQAPVVAGVTSLATPTINGNTAIVKLGGLDVAGGANSCSLTALLANGEKLVNTIYFKQEEH
jgi:hypothetical protein